MIKDNKDQTYNLFIESDVQKKMELEKDDVGFPYITNDHMGELINYSRENYNKIPNLKIFLTDIRGDTNKPLIGCATYSYNFDIENLFKLLENIGSFKKDVNYREIFFDFANRYIKFVLASQIIIKTGTKDKDLEKASSNLLLNEVINLRNNYPLIYSKISRIILPIINAFLNDILVESKDNISIDQLDNIYIKGLLAGTVITDMYLLAKLFQSTNNVNNIVYVGAGHYYTIKKVLLELDFKLIKEIEAPENNNRCVENIIQFDNFFKDPY